MHRCRALVGRGAGGAIAPPTFLDLLNRYQFLPKNSNFFISTSTPKIFLAPPISKCRRGPCQHQIKNFYTNKEQNICVPMFYIDFYCDNLKQSNFKDKM